MLQDFFSILGYILEPTFAFIFFLVY